MGWSDEFFLMLLLDTCRSSTFTTIVSGPPLDDSNRRHCRGEAMNVEAPAYVFGGGAWNDTIGLTIGWNYQTPLMVMMTSQEQQRYGMTWDGDQCASGA